MGQSKTSRYYATHPEAAAHRRSEQRKINRKPEKRSYRSELNKANRKIGTYGNRDGLDLSHTKKGTLVKEKASSNRARNGSGGRSTKK